MCVLSFIIHIYANMYTVMTIICVDCKVDEVDECTIFLPSMFSILGFIAKVFPSDFSYR